MLNSVMGCIEINYMRGDELVAELTFGDMPGLKLGLFRRSDVEFTCCIESSVWREVVGALWSNFHPPLALRLLKREFV
jgi:hypothetical protein